MSIDQGICGRCLHVFEEHHGRRCLPSLEGGSACECDGYVELTQWRAQELRQEASKLQAMARRIERFGSVQ